MSLPNVNKVTILSFSDNKLNKLIRAFVVPINPEHYTRNYKVNYDRTQPIGAQSNDDKFSTTSPETLRLEFTFDNTGTVQGNILNGVPIPLQVEGFLRVVYDMEGKIHKPRYLKVVWGTIILNCQVTDVSVNYNLFDALGIPLRAKISVNFREFVEPVKRTQEEGKGSPDLTHIRKVTEGQNLPLMTFDIYDDTRFYMQVAKANGLTSFRNLNPNKEIVFPPIDKELNA